MGKRGSVKLAGDAKKGIEDALRKQISLLGSTNRALEKQNENLHRRVEHLRKELNKKAKEVEELRERYERAGGE
jgi:predicted RNase H-like nuclease (RuvC/YqgF family)